VNFFDVRRETTNKQTKYIVEAQIEEDQTGPRLPSEVKERMERSEDKGRGREEEGTRGAEGGGVRHKARGM